MGHAALSDRKTDRHQIDGDNAVSGFEYFVKENTDHYKSLDLLIEGVHCAACIQKIESTIARQPDVKYVRLNFTTKRLNITWDGAADRANDFVTQIRGLGYGVQAFNPDAVQEGSKEEEKFLLRCLGIAGFAMGNIMLISIGLWITNQQSMGMATRDLLHWVSALIAVPTILVAGRPFFRSAFAALKNGQTNMDVPITIGVSLACALSLYETATHGEHAYFDSAVMLIFFLLIGRYFDLRARRSARSAATDLLGSLSGFANVIDGSMIKKMPIRELREDMMVLVPAGEKFPADGHIVEGATSIDTALVTGESIPQEMGAGGHVFAGTLNLSAPVVVRVAKAAEDSLLADIVRLMERAEQGQAKYVRIADRAAKLYTPLVHSLALIAFLFWWLGMGAPWQDAMMIGITVLIITCPCALGLAVPVVQVLATGRLMKSGVLVKSGDALERLAVIDTIIFDKTGTLTRGQPALDGAYPDAQMQLAASLGSHSAHPLAKVLKQAWSGKILPLSDIEEIPGKGMQARYDGKVICLGSRDWCGDKGAPPAQGPEIWLQQEDKKSQVFSFTDGLRADSAATVERLKQEHLKLIMLTGDQETAAQNMAREAGGLEYKARQSPPQKFDALKAMQAQGHKILMVGDGLNDTPALAAADVSMAPGSAIDMAQNAADIVYMGDALAPVYDTYKTACFSQKLVRQNFMLAIAYNLIAVPVAFAGLVTPMIAALAMSCSSLIVIANAFRLKGKR